MNLDTLSPEDREIAEGLLAKRAEILADNPLQGFHACPEWCGSPDCPPPTERNPTGGRPKQYEFMADPHEIVASNAGNRFGKTTALVGFSIIQHTPDEMLPDRLKVFKRRRHKPNVPLKGRYLLPSEQFLEETLTEFHRWTPKSILLGGNWAKAWRGQHNILSFEDGSKLGFFTYKQDASMLAGWEGDYGLWDEPPPAEHWREMALRLFARKGCHRFGMTPVNMVGGGIGWVKRELFDRAKPDNPDYDPNIHIVRASIHDNPDYSKEEIEKVLARYPADERQAREHGDFIHFGGMVYPGGFHRVLKKPLDPKRLEGNDIVVGIDPGVKNAAFVWVSFDRDNVAVAFDNVLIREGTMLDYAKAIRQTNLKWGLKEPPVYVIDPSARNRNSINLLNIESELNLQGIYTIHGFNPVEAGIQSIRRRIAEGGFFVTENCQGLREEADEYRMEDRDDGEFKIVKENDHRLDALRYALMSRPWYATPDFSVENNPWDPSVAPDYRWLEENAPEPVGGPPLYLS